MNYVQELSDQLLLLNKNEKMKIDVHFIVSEPLNSFCVNLNRKIQHVNQGLIHMGREAIILPHISIFMGYVTSYQMLDLLISNVGTYAQSQSPFCIDPTSMYFKGLTKNAPQYLFIDFLQNQYITEQKRKLSALLKDIVLPMDWNMEEEPPHITVGCYNKITEKALSIIDENGIIPPCMISQIGVSVSGNKGVCLGLLKVYQLQ